MLVAAWVAVWMVWMIGIDQLSLSQHCVRYGKIAREWMNEVKRSTFLLQEVDPV